MMSLRTFLTPQRKKLLIRALGMATLTALAEISVIAILYSSAALASGHADVRVFGLFILTLILFLVSVRKLRLFLLRVFEHYVTQTRITLMEAVRHADVRSLEQIDAEAVYTALTHDINAVSDISHMIATMVYTTFFTIGCLGLVAYVSPYAFLLSCVTLTLVGIGYFYVYLQLRHAIPASQECEQNIFKAMTHLLDGFKELRLNNNKNDHFFHHGFVPHGQTLRTIRRQTARHFIDTYTVTYGAWKMLITLTVLIVPLWGMLYGDALITVVGILLGLPLNYLIEQLPSILLTGIGFQRFSQLKQRLEHLHPTSVNSDTRQVAFEELSYRNLSFRYENSGERPFSVGPVNLIIHAGDIVFMTGGNGSGKTTLFKLLVGLYSPDSGQVVLNGQEVEIHQHRYLFSPVFSDFHLV